MNIIKLNKVDSTNAYLKRSYKQLNNFDVVFANKQTKGKGRNNHVWKSQDKKNLLCSFLIKDKNIISKGSKLSLLTAVAVLKTLGKLKLNNLSIKWPNDIYVKDKKICGILLESKSINCEIECIVIGVGINLNQTKFRKEYHATSYKLETKKEIKIKDVLSILIKELQKIFDINSNYISFINNHNFLKNKIVKITINNKKVKAHCLEIDKTGKLSVIYNKKIIKVNSNEVEIIN